MYILNTLLNILARFSFASFPIGEFSGGKFTESRLGSQVDEACRIGRVTAGEICYPAQLLAVKVLLGLNAAFGRV